MATESSSEADLSLSGLICDRLKTSVFDSKSESFLPADEIDKLVSLKAIQERLEEDKNGLALNDEEIELVNWIHQKANKVFAIVVLAGLQIASSETLKSMKYFKVHEFNNSSLPIKDPRLSSGKKWKCPEKFDSLIWKKVRLSQFYDKQWWFLAPVFATDYRYNLESDCTLPFIGKDQILREGAFSFVHKVTIHKAHANSSYSQVVAIKEIRVNRGLDMAKIRAEAEARNENEAVMLERAKAKTEEAWEREAMALESMNKIHNPHIVKCIAAIRRGDNRYFMFPWADGDSLRDFWEAKSEQGPKLDKDIIHQLLQQLRGLANALDRIHNFEDKPNKSSDPEEDSPESKVDTPAFQLNDETLEYTFGKNPSSIRHGDLKPENLLRFPDHKTKLGTLKIADMGLAKRHVVATQDRRSLTTTPYSTIRYEAPEARTAPQGLSRLYDIWSMGCITLESVIWVLYGYNELQKFYKDLKGGTEKETEYYETEGVAPNKTAKVHHVVRKWIEVIQKIEPECSRDSAINDLLKLVKTKLLVVRLPPNRPSTMEGGGMKLPQLLDPEDSDPPEGVRATARIFRDQLGDILIKVEIPDYLVTGKARAMKPSEHIEASSGHALGTARIPPSSSNEHLGASSTILDDTIRLEKWEFDVDNTFAEEVTHDISYDTVIPNPPKLAKLCSRCEKLNFWAGGFSFEGSPSELHDMSEGCDFCRILWGICLKYDTTQYESVRFERDQSTLRMTDGPPLPVLSLFKSPELDTPLPIQIGLPRLPLINPDNSSMNEDFFKILKHWLTDCDTKHHNPKCKGDFHTNLPTRLIHVGTKVKPALRLLETASEKPGQAEYIALSHPWGDPKTHPPFKTLRKDKTGQGRELHKFKEAIPYDQLPMTFKDAVDTTRALGVQYLWIDSICIIQGDDGDFNQESKRMEDVFSHAYCVISASCATGQHSGFLKPRPQREFLTLEDSGKGLFYICDFIDNFGEDALNSSLSKRGWVFQEHALARRTIFFTQTQTYFECGRGVRCETLTKMHNNKADFLGDPNFPDKVMKQSATRALKIRHFQDLYKKYSRLSFSYWHDRPFGVAGLEARLRKAYQMPIHYGIFDDGPAGGFFHRSLLWCLAEGEKPMTSITFEGKPNTSVPSWSWMAYQGAIDYLEPPFHGVDWETKEIRPPWTRGGDGGRAETNHNYDEADFQATVRDYTVAGRSRLDEVKLVYDTERSRSDRQSPQCVVVAKAKQGRSDREKKHFVLIVAASGGSTAGGYKTYTRLGVGYMAGKFIDLDSPGILAKIY